MKLQFKPLIVNLAITIVVALASCQKENSTTPLDSSLTTASAVQAAAVATSSVAITASTETRGDSIYAFQTCGSFEHRDSIAFSNLPAAVASYLSTNYSGYSALKSFSISNSAGTLTGYVTVILFNNNPVAIKFDSTGAFIEVLELREGRDLLNQHGYHQGGCFQNRDSLHQDTLAIDALPATITSYFSSNYPQDTLLKALKTFSGNYVVLSKDDNLYATIFSGDGTFISRDQLPTKTGRISSIAQNALPVNILNYLTSTYPGYVFDKSFSIARNGVLQGYFVVIDANNTKYGIEFDSSGNFVKVKSII